MSGADQKEAQDQLISGMKSKYPQCSQNVYIASDTAGAIATATEKGTRYSLSNKCSSLMTSHRISKVTIYSDRKKKVTVKPECDHG